MSSHLIWKNDIENRFSPTSLTDATDGDGFIATAIISSVTTNSEWKMSLWAAYQTLREKLLDGESELLPESTTTQRDALSSLVAGTLLFNVTTMREEIYTGSAWINVAGSGTLDPVAFGEMIEDNSSGSTINSTTKLWSTASVGELDPNSIVTFSDLSSGDKLVIGTGGAGTYQVHFSCVFTNDGGNITEAGIHKNGAEVGKLEDIHSGDSSEQRDLRGQGFLVLADDDELTLHVVSTTAGDIVKVYHCHVTVVRLT